MIFMRNLLFLLVLPALALASVLPRSVLVTRDTITSGSTYTITNVKSGNVVDLSGGDGTKSKFYNMTLFIPPPYFPPLNYISTYYSHWVPKSRWIKPESTSIRSVLCFLIRDLTSESLSHSGSFSGLLPDGPSNPKGQPNTSEYLQHPPSTAPLWWLPPPPSLGTSGWTKRIRLLTGSFPNPTWLVILLVIEFANWLSSTVGSSSTIQPRTGT